MLSKAMAIATIAIKENDFICICVYKYMVVDGGRGAIFCTMFVANPLVAAADAFRCVTVGHNVYTCVPLEMLAVHPPWAATVKVVY